MTARSWSRGSARTADVRTRSNLWQRGGSGGVGSGGGASLVSPRAFTGGSGFLGSDGTDTHAFSADVFRTAKPIGHSGRGGRSPWTFMRAARCGATILKSAFSDWRSSGFDRGFVNVAQPPARKTSDPIRIVRRITPMTPLSPVCRPSERASRRKTIRSIPPAIRIFSEEFPDCRRRRGFGVHVECQLSAHGKQPLSVERRTHSRQIDTVSLPSVYGRPFWHATAGLSCHGPDIASSGRPAPAAAGKRLGETPDRLRRLRRDGS